MNYELAAPLAAFCVRYVCHSDGIRPLYAGFSTRFLALLGVFTKQTIAERQTSLGENTKRGESLI